MQTLSTSGTKSCLCPIGYATGITIKWRRKNHTTCLWQYCMIYISTNAQGSQIATLAGVSTLQGNLEERETGGHPQTPAQGLPPLRTLLIHPIVLLMQQKKG